MTFAPPAGALLESGRPFRLTTSDHIGLRAVIWPQPDTKAKGTIVILPGRTEYCEKYARVAADLNAQGYAVSALDWRGQGLSQRLLPDPRKGHVESFGDYQKDMTVYLALLESQNLPRPWFMLAHSMGGCIGLRALESDHPFKAAIFSAPMWDIIIPEGGPKRPERILSLACRMGLGSRYAPPPAPRDVSLIEDDLFEGNPLTQDRPTWDWLRAHLHGNPQLTLAGPTVRWLLEALTECKALSLRPSPALPCLTTLGTEESIVSPKAIHDRINRWPLARLVTLPQCQHEAMMEIPTIRASFFAQLNSFLDQKRADPHHPAL